MNGDSKMAINLTKQQWLRGTGAGILRGLIWATLWTPLGLLLGLIVDPEGTKDEPWILIGAYPGFLCGVVFSAVIMMAERHSRLDQLSLARGGALGALSGLLVGAFWLGLVLLSDPPRWLLSGSVVVSITILSAVTAILSAWLTRRADG